jgi:hypothetical protein
MSVITGMTELAAVNRMLLGIGQTPVNTLEVAGIRDVSIARLTLEQVSFEIQSKGYRFNTFETTLTPRVEDNRILVPADVISVEALELSEEFSVEADAEAPSVRYLMDRNKNTDEFTRPVKLLVVRFLEWPSLPGHVSNYITAEAAARFQDQQVGSPSLAAPLERSRQFAYAGFRKQELRQGRPNIIKDGIKAYGGEGSAYGPRRQWRWP